MDYKEKAEEIFTTIVSRKKYIEEMPLKCSNGENGTLLYLTFVKSGITISELSEILGVSVPRAVSIINKLKIKKLIKRNVDKRDRRKVIITITSKGKSIISNLKQQTIEKIEKLIKDLNEEEIKQYIEITKKIAKTVEEIQG